MTIFSCNNLSKAFDRGTLFESLSFGIDSGERLGLIGKNGAGKTTLMDIIAGLDLPDSGEVVFNNNVTFEYLRQIPQFDREQTIIETVLSAKSDIMILLEKYRKLCDTFTNGNNDSLSDEINSLTRQIEAADGWNFENEAKKILTKLGIDDIFENIKNLSGGMKKRVALARALASNPDLIIMDEPTNHLDADSVQWLQDQLQSSHKSLLFVSHDRYFLDAVSTRIIELDRKRIFNFPGNYQSYLEKKEAIVEAHNSHVEKVRSKLRTELAWLQKGAKARRSKQKSRVDWIEKLKELDKPIKEKRIEIELGSKFVGSRIIDAYNISKTVGQKKLFQNFTYVAKPTDRIGIIGPNGSGKSTLLNVLAGNTAPDTGSHKLGASVNIGFFRQEITDLRDDNSLMGSLKEIAEYIDVGEGRDRYLTCKDLLNKFLFPPKQHSSLVGTLSGGEKRRLSLLRVLMDNPNVLLLDEPTNDLDIPTLSALENYLDDFFGTLLVVSHDRAFLDRTVDFIFSFDGKGNIKEYPGNYSQYLERKEQEQKQLAEDKIPVSKPIRSKNNKKTKLSYMEQREFDLLEQDIPLMEAEKEKISSMIESGEINDYKKLEELSHRLILLEQKIDSATERWLELSEMTE